MSRRWRGKAKRTRTGRSSLFDGGRPETKTIHIYARDLRGRRPGGDRTRRRGAGRRARRPERPAWRRRWSGWNNRSQYGSRRAGRRQPGRPLARGQRAGVVRIVPTAERRARLGRRRARDAAKENGRRSPGVAVAGCRLRNGIIVAKEVLTGDEAAQALLARATAAGAAVTASAAVPAGMGRTASAPSMSKAAAAHAPVRPAGRRTCGLRGGRENLLRLPGAGRGMGRAGQDRNGITPSAVFDASGRLHVAYTNEFLGNYDILSVNMLPGSAWSLPRVVAADQWEVSRSGRSRPRRTAGCTSRGRT